MATYYWVGGSGSANDPSHWSLTSGGSPAGVAPTYLDNAVFDSASGSGACVFTVDFDITNFVADGNGSTLLNANPGVSINVWGDFDLKSAYTPNIPMFSSTGVVLKQPSNPGNYYVYTGGLTLTNLTIQRSTGANTYIESTAYIGTATIDRLVLTSGSVYLGYNSTNVYNFGFSSGPGAIAIDASSSNLKSINVFGSTKVQFGAPALLGPSSSSNATTLNFSTASLIHCRGSNLYIQTSSTGASVQLPRVYNYIGEDQNGAPVGSGGTLVFTGSPITLERLVCTAVGSNGSGSYARTIQFSETYQTTFSNNQLYPLYAAGDSTNKVFLRSNSSGNQADLLANIGGTSNGVLRVTDCNLADLNGLNPGVYIAYASDGNVDAGNNTNWQFAESTSGMLVFFL